MKVIDGLLEDLWTGEKAVCFFVHEGCGYWVVDYKYNFSLDAERDYSALLDKGYITREQYFQACKGFRGGVLRLTAENFLSYIWSVASGVFVAEELKVFFESVESNKENIFKVVEEYYLTGLKLSEGDFCRAGQLASLLPMFYINFDRRIYMHMDFGRSHEDLAYADWYSKCSDFSFLIPDSQRYWVCDGDFWKLKFL